MHARRQACDEIGAPVDRTESDSGPSAPTTGPTVAADAAGPTVAAETRVRIWLINEPYGLSARVSRALSQRLYLVDSEALDCVQGPGRSFKVLGSTGNIYTVTIGERRRLRLPRRGQRQRVQRMQRMQRMQRVQRMQRMQGKHRLFVMLRVLRQAHGSPLIYQDALVASERVDMLRAAPAASEADGVLATGAVRTAYRSATAKAPAAKEGGAVHRGVETDGCPICFEELGGVDGVEVCAECKNGIHTNCFKQWGEVRRRSHDAVSCPICRAAWPGADEQQGPEGYLNLGAAAGVPEHRHYGTYSSFRRGYRY